MTDRRPEDGCGTGASDLTAAGRKSVRRCDNSRGDFASLGRQGGEGWRFTGGAAWRGATLEADGNAAKVDADEQSLDLGVSYAGADGGFAFGLSGGAIRGTTNVHARGSEVSFDGWSISGFGRYGRLDRGFSLAAGANFAHVEGSAARDVALPGTARRASSAVSLDAVSLGLEARYAFRLGSGVTAGPTASFSHTSTDLGQVSETGADSLNLSSTGASEQASRYSAGLFVKYAGRRTSLSAKIGCAGGASDAADVTLRLAGAPDTPFTVLAPHNGPTAARFDISAATDLGRGWSIGGAVSRLVGTDRSSSSAAARVTLRF
jgi:hypothetical protein